MTPANELGPGQRLGRRGKIIVLFGALLPFLVGGMALSVDTGVIGTARSQLQTAADAAALAGARQFAFNRKNTFSTIMMGKIRSDALAMVARNKVLRVTPVLNDNPSNSTTGEIVLGRLNSSDFSRTIPDTSGPVSNFNSVLIKLSRDASHGGVVPGFFSSLFTKKGSSLKVFSTATMRAYEIAGAKSVGNQSATLLPIVLDKPTFDAMMAGTTTDEFEWSDLYNSVRTGPDGITESKLYPVKNGNPGNWGTIKVGVSNNSTSTLGEQIRYGITPGQLATFPGSKIELNQNLSPPSITFEGNPGISAGIKDDLESIIGKPVFIPIYDQTGGNGNNAWYRVIKFAGVRIVFVDFKGNPKFVIVQPANVTDPTAIPNTNKEVTLDQGGAIQLHLSR